MVLIKNRINGMKTKLNISVSKWENKLISIFSNNKMCFMQPHIDFIQFDRYTENQCLHQFHRAFPR